MKITYETSVVAAVTAATIMLSSCGLNSATEHQQVEIAVVEHLAIESVDFSDLVITRFGTRACVSWQTPGARGIAQLARAGEKWFVLRAKQYNQRQCEPHLVSRLDRRSEAFVELYYLLERGRVKDPNKIRELLASLKGIADLEYVNPSLDQQLTRYIEELVRLEKSIWKTRRAMKEL